jgi:Raf kinase inhibitor-like YbhB/YbcL family protein
MAGRALAAVTTVAVLTGCSTDGRALAPAQPDQTQSVLDPTTTVAPDPAQPPSSLTVQVAWTAEASAPDEMAVANSCDGAGTSPEVRWSGVPAAAVEMAVAVVDLDAEGYVHWLVAGLDPLGFVPAGALPPGALTLPNTAGSPGWTPPCPPEGAGHRYQLTVYAMAAAGLAGALSADEAIEYLDGEAIIAADIVARYAR